jgi:hypothetical protein
MQLDPAPLAAAPPEDGTQLPDALSGQQERPSGRVTGWSSGQTWSDVVV